MNHKINPPVATVPPSVKQCKACEQYKVFYPEKQKDRKASGFQGNLCWPCYLAYQKALRITGLHPLSRLRRERSR